MQHVAMKATGEGYEGQGMYYQHRPAQEDQLPSSQGNSETHYTPDCTAGKLAANKYVCKNVSIG